MNLILFEDALAKQLAPVSLTRPTWAIRCASYRLFDLIGMLGEVTAIVRPHLQSLQESDWPECSQKIYKSQGQCFLVNARIAPTIENTERLLEFFRSVDYSDQPTMLFTGSTLVVAWIPGEFADQVSTDCETDRVQELEQLSLKHFPLRKVKVEFEMFEYPHDIVALHMKHCNTSFQHRIENTSTRYKEIQDGVFVAAQTKIPKSTEFDTSDGPVIFESNVRVGPFCFFRGPVHVAPNSKISEHSSIKDAVAISHTCKMGGEIEGVQTEPWSNKQHFGFLGHSYIGSWINLGAGTCNSDLKNTYGTVNMTYGDQKVSTGMQFVGCVMGDYSRTAINTSIYTGKVIGVGSTIYGMTPHNVPSFVNCAQSLNQTGVLPPEVLVSIQQRMFGRRNVTQRPCDIQLIHDVFKMTAHERDPSWSTDHIAF